MGLSWGSLGLVCSLLLVGGHAEKLVCVFSPISPSMLHIKGHFDAWESGNQDFGDSS